MTKVLDDGGAKDAGVKDGDVILKIGSRDVNSVASLQKKSGNAVRATK